MKGPNWLKKREHSMSMPRNDGMDSVSDAEKARLLITGRHITDEPNEPYNVDWHTRRMLNQQTGRYTPAEEGVEPSGGGQAGNSPFRKVKLKRK